MTRGRDYTVQLWSRIDKDGEGGCWLWTGPIHRTGYAHVWTGYGAKGRTNVYLHRWVWEQLVAPIPDGRQLDHLCRVRHCVNPKHLEPVTAQINVHRSTAPSAVNAAATHCKHGHEFTPENVYIRTNGNRACRTCQSRHGRAYRLRLKDAA